MCIKSVCPSSFLHIPIPGYYLTLNPVFPNFFLYRVNLQNNFSYSVEILPMKTDKIQSNITIR